MDTLTSGSATAPTPLESVVRDYIETANGPYFAKLLGPSQTVAKWYDSYVAYLKTAR